MHNSKDILHVLVDLQRPKLGLELRSCSFYKLLYYKHMKRVGNDSQPIDIVTAEYWSDLFCL